MKESSYALVLTGDVLPGHSPDAVWPALAAYFRMEPERLATQLLARAPLAIKQDDDLGKLQTLQAGAAATGAETQLCAPDGRPALFVLLEGAPRGPVPRVFVEERIAHGLWPDDITVAEVGSNSWKPWIDPATRAVVPPPAPEADAAPAAEVAVVAPASGLAELPAETFDGDSLPPGEAIHAGFWRRCAAMLIDGLLLGVVSAVVQAAVGLGAIGSGMTDTSAIAAAMGTIMLVSALLFVGQWLYYALFESSALQATPGKLALGIKVVDEAGKRIGFGQASGRWFAKIVSNLILGIGYLMAGFTARKQALHDMMAGTLVVFADVAPGRPLPTVRPPMPWYGWVLNILFIGLGLLAVAGMFAAFAMLGDLITNGLQGAQGF
jgi:uncharacterized RDD family membrane protein YckC